MNGLTMMLKSFGFDPEDMKSKVEEGQDMMRRAVEAMERMDARQERMEAEIGLIRLRQELILQDMNMRLAPVIPPLHIPHGTEEGAIHEKEA